MFRRFLKIAIIYLPIGLIIGIFVVTAENQKPWLIALVIFFLVFAVFGNMYVFFGRGKKD